VEPDAVEGTGGVRGGGGVLVADGVAEAAVSTVRVGVAGRTSGVLVVSGTMVGRLGVLPRAGTLCVSFVSSLLQANANRPAQSRRAIASSRSVMDPRYRFREFIGL
jgi:hypothetical protein